MLSSGNYELNLRFSPRLISPLFPFLHSTSLHFISLHFTSLLFFFLFPASSASDVLSMLVYIYLLAHVSFQRSHSLLSTPLFLRKANGLIDGTFLPDFVGIK